MEQYFEACGKNESLYIACASKEWKYYIGNAEMRK